MKRDSSRTKPFLSLLIASLIVCGVLAVSFVRASGATGISVDGSVKGGCGYVMACSLLLTTAHSPDVVIVGCDCWPYHGSFTVSDTAGLNFQQRTGQVSIGGGQFIQTWYAIASNPLTADSISVRSTLTGETWYGVVVFAVSGANTTSPFDSNPSIPKTQANIGCSGNDPCNTGVSTSANDLVFQFGGDTGYTTQTAGTGFTLIQANAVGQDAYAQYEIASSPLSSATLSFGTSQVSDFGVIADAIRPATSATSSTSTSTTTTTTSTTSRYLARAHLPLMGARRPGVATSQHARSPSRRLILPTLSS